MSLSHEERVRRSERKKKSKDFEDYMSSNPEFQHAIHMFTAEYVAKQISPFSGARTPKRFVKSDALKIFDILSHFNGLAAIPLSARENWEVIAEKLMARGLYSLLAGPSLSLQKDQEFFADLEGLHLKHFAKTQVNFSHVSSTPPRNINKVAPKAPRKSRVPQNTDQNGNGNTPRAVRRNIFAAHGTDRNNNLPMTPSVSALNPGAGVNNRLEFSIEEEDQDDNAAIMSSQDSASNNDNIIQRVVTNFSNVMSRVASGNDVINSNLEPRNQGNQVPMFQLENEEDDDMVSDGGENMLRLKYQQENENDASAQPLAQPLALVDGNQWGPLELHRIVPGMRVKHSNPENVDFLSGEDQVERVTEKKVKIVNRKGYFYPKNLLFLNLDA